jgi:hypothetical protein
MGIQTAFHSFHALASRLNFSLEYIRHLEQRSTEGNHENARYAGFRICPCRFGVHPGPFHMCLGE